MMRVPPPTPEIPRKIVAISAVQRWERCHHRPNVGFEPTNGVTFLAVADDGTAWIKEEYQANWGKIGPLPPG